MKEKIHTGILGVTILFLILYFMQFMGFPNSIAVMVGGILCIYMVIQQRKINPGVEFCLLALAFFTHFFFLNGKRVVVETIVYIPLILYMLGNLMVCKTKGHDNTEERFLLLLFVVVLGYTIHGGLNSYLYLAGYNAGNDGREWMDVWKKYFIPGTQHNVYYLPVFSMVFPAIVFFKKRKCVNIAVIIGTVFFLYMSLLTKSRLAILIFALVLLAQILLYIILERRTIKEKGIKKYLYTALGIALIFAVIGVLVLKNTEIISAFINNMSKDGGVLNNVRFVAQGNVLKNLLNYPMGGMDKSVIGFNYAHNVWLDMAKRTGIIPFAFLVLYTGYTIYEMFRFVSRKNVSSDVKLMTIGLYVAFFLYFMVEPALEASIHYLTPWLFVNGMVHGNISKEKNKNERNC